MTILTFTAVLGLSSFVAGLIGALTGLGGGVVIVPLLVIVFGVDIRYAIGARVPRFPRRTERPAIGQRHRV
jgi:uncharacterized membrane protein YfcA